MAAMKREDIQTQGGDRQALPDLFAKLADDITQLFDAKLALLRVELREEVDAYIRDGVMMVLGSVVALVGFALLNIAIAFLIAALFQSTNLSQPVRYSIGFAITAVVYLAIGMVLVIVYKNKLTTQRLVPTRTVAELKRDKEAIEKEI